MRALHFLVLLGLCCPVAAQSLIATQEYVFVLRRGRSFTRVLPIDWEPRHEGAWLRIDPRHRVLGQDVVLIHPGYPLDPHTLESVRVMRRQPTRTAANYVLWLPPGSVLQVGDPQRTELEQVAPHTWLRPNEFHMVLRGRGGP